MRIALLDPPSYTPLYDHCLAAGLTRRAHVVDVLASRFLHGQAPEPKGYTRHEIFFPATARLLSGKPRSRLRYPLKALEYLPSVRRLLRRLDELDPDVVHVQWLTLPRLDRRWLRGVAGARPTVFTAHNVMRRQEPERIDVWREIFATVDRVVVHSRSGALQLAELGVEPGRIARIPHATFAPPAADAPAAPNGATLLFFGLLRAYKGLDLLVRALEPVARVVPGVRLVVAGDPLDPVESVRQLASDTGVSDRIQWRLGYVPESEIADLMRAATVVVLPYRESDASGALATAVGHGRPVVVSDVGSLGETVREFGAGLVVPPGDVEALALACIRLLTDERALSAAFRGTRNARDALSWDAAALAHERLYQALVTAPSRNRASARVGAR